MKIGKGGTCRVTSSFEVIGPHVCHLGHMILAHHTPPLTEGYEVFTLYAAHTGSTPVAFYFCPTHAYCYVFVLASI
jgi:hypothetical protein